MKARRRVSGPVLACLAVLLLVVASPRLHAQEADDLANEYRITVFPNYPIKGRLTGFGYLGYVMNFDKGLQVLLPRVARSSSGPLEASRPSST